MRSSRKASLAQNVTSLYAKGNGALRTEDVNKKWNVWVFRVIHKSVRDFRTRLRNNQDRHGRKDTKPPLHSHNWLNFGKFQDTERFLIHCERHFSSRLPPSGGTWKYAKASSTKKKLGEILYLLICFLPCLSWLLRSRVRKSGRDLWITLYSEGKMGTESI